MIESVFEPASDFHKLFASILVFVPNAVRTFEHFTCLKWNEVKTCMCM